MESLRLMEQETVALRHSVDQVSKRLRKLEKKRGVERVHKARVALRHLMGILSILPSNPADTRFETRVHSPLRLLLKRLGKVRDSHVALQNIEILGGSESLEKEFRRREKKGLRGLDGFLQENNINKSLRGLRNHFHLKGDPAASGHADSLNDRKGMSISKVLDSQELEVRRLSASPKSADDYHELRLAVKKWRYLLEDLYGAKHQVIDSAQEKLGALHDLDLLAEHLTDAEDTMLLRKNLGIKRDELLSEVADLIPKFPYGYRPAAGKIAS